MKVSLFVDHPLAPKFDRVRLSAIAREIVHEEKKRAESISIVLVDDNYLLDVNRRFLKHNYRTDVISFDLNPAGDIDGEVYVSVDRAAAQAKRYKIPVRVEILRLIVHGVLHLCGWDDSTRSEKLRMRKRENVFIERFFARRNSR